MQRYGGCTRPKVQRRKRVAAAEGRTRWMGKAQGAIDSADDDATRPFGTHQTLRDPPDLDGRRSPSPLAQLSSTRVARLSTVRQIFRYRSSCPRVFHLLAVPHHRRHRRHGRIVEPPSLLKNRHASILPFVALLLRRCDGQLRFRPALEVAF